MTLEKVLNIYTTWIKIYIEEAKKINLSDDQIQKLLEIYRAPVSENDFMFLAYCHDIPRGCLYEDIKMLR